MAAQILCCHNIILGKTGSGQRKLPLFALADLEKDLRN